VKKTSLILALILILSGHMKSQENNISIMFIGNCGFYFTDGEFSFVIDFPYRSGAYGYMKYDKSILDSLNPDICLFTHGHADHFRKRLFKKLDTQLFAPGPLKMRLSPKRKISFKELNNLHPDFKVTFFKTPHGFSLKHYSYLIEWKGKRIYVSGDTHDKEHLLKLKGLDVALVNPWLLIDIYEHNQIIDTKKVILCHHTRQDKITATGKKLMILEQNEVFELE